MTAPETRWTAETEELVASRGAGSFAARDILEALARAGLLLPPGGTWSEQRGATAMSVFAASGTTVGEIVTQATHKRSVWTGSWIEVPS